MNRLQIIFAGCVLVILPIAKADIDPLQKFRITVLDVSGNPMEGVPCHAYFHPNTPDTNGMDTKMETGKTDGSGTVDLSGKTIWYYSSADAELPGYYTSSVNDFWTLKRNGDHWEPWPVEVKLVMKKIIRPHPMYAAENDIFFPDAKKYGPVGYDLLEMDWVAPAGKGKTADFVLEGTLQNPADKTEDPRGWLRLSFPHPGDGIQRAELSEAGWSELVGPHEAPEAGYLPEWKFQTWENEEDAQAGNVKPKQVYVFRVRTVLDKDGKVVSARYGKIPEQMNASLFHMRPGVILKYYLNGTDNDRGLEWDMKTNLFQDLDKALWLKRP